MVIRNLQFCVPAQFKNVYISSILLLLLINLEITAVNGQNQSKNQKLGIGTAATTTPSGRSIINKNINSNNKSEIVEGSANGPHGRLADVEVNGSGYPTDDEDGDDVHGSGSPVPTSPPSSPSLKPKPVAPPPPPSKAETMKPVTTTVGPSPTVVKPVTNTDRQKELKVDSEEDDDDDEDEDDEEDEDEDFADENVHDDMDVFTTSTTTQKPFIASLTTTPKSYAQPTPIPPRVNQAPTTTVSSGPFSAFHETMTNGFYAAVAGGVIVAVLTAILLVLFVWFRIKKKDEGSYALDEPKQTRPYATYAYTKASSKEFYA